MGIGHRMSNYLITSPEEKPVASVAGDRVAETSCLHVSLTLSKHPRFAKVKNRTLQTEGRGKVEDKNIMSGPHW